MGKGFVDFVSEDLGRGETLQPETTTETVTKPLVSTKKVRVLLLFPLTGDRGVTLFFVWVGNLSSPFTITPE